MTPNRVVLPAPLRPTRPTRAPVGMRAKAPSKSLRPAMRTVRSSIMSMPRLVADGAARRNPVVLFDRRGSKVGKPTWQAPRGLTVRGLTTAASIWITAAIGILVGIGFWYTAILGTIAVLLVLAVFRVIEARLPSEFYAHHMLRFPRDRAM